MNDSILMHLSRSGEVIFSDCDEIPHTDDVNTIMHIAVAVLNAGYTGIAVDELKLSNGRFAQALDVDLATPEGRLFQMLSTISSAGGKLPEEKIVLDALERVYQQEARLGGDV